MKKILFHYFYLFFLGSPILAIALGISIYYFFYALGSYFHSLKSAGVVFCIMLISLVFHLYFHYPFIAIIILIFFGYLFGTIFSVTLCLLDTRYQMIRGWHFGYIHLFSQP